jgi:hypothetical protein
METENVLSSHENELSSHKQVIHDFGLMFICTLLLLGAFAITLSFVIINNDIIYNLEEFKANITKIENYCILSKLHINGYKEDNIDLKFSITIQYNDTKICDTIFESKAFVFYYNTKNTDEFDVYTDTQITDMIQLTMNISKVSIVLGIHCCLIIVITFIIYKVLQKRFKSFNEIK